uniref:Uncharacterized protein n=1 Tax=Oryza brachyantha TaxID=4533 RepID=J3KWB8_ORYBR
MISASSGSEEKKNNSFSTDKFNHGCISYIFIFRPFHASDKFGAIQYMVSFS